MVDVFYLFDLICDWNFYAFYDSHGLLVTSNAEIRALFWRSRARVVAKILLCLPWYFASNWLYTLKLLSGIHFRTLYVCIRKIVDFVGALVT